MKIMIVGGTWNEQYNATDNSGYTGLYRKSEDGMDKDLDSCKLNHAHGRASGLVTKVIHALKPYASELFFANGGKYSDLQTYLEQAKDYDVVFWWANVDNSLPKVRDVKAVAPHTLLVTSKRNDVSYYGNRKYDFEDLIQRSLKAKANLCFEFSKAENSLLFGIRVFDPLGCLWYDGTNIEDAVTIACERLLYLSSVTRKGSSSVGELPEITFSKTDDKFLEIVKSSANTFHKLMQLPEHVDRFVGNASLRFKNPTRCMNGFPGIRKGDTILISRRNVDKTGITLDDFVPCRLGDVGEVTYLGDKKPSVDAPVQLRLFEKLPNIDYILHGHCYVENAPMTKTVVPCGAIEEIDAVMPCVEEYYGTDADFIAVNLKGHGCLIMAGKNKLKKMKGIEFVTRPMPEIM